MTRWVSLLGCLALAGCASWGGNVRGDFACAAPQGTCAPTAEIDARAMAKVVRMSSVGASAPTLAAGVARTVQSDALTRADERVLRIVFYPHIDEQGHLHEKAAVRAVVAGRGWQDGAEARARGSVQTEPRDSVTAGASVDQMPASSASRSSAYQSSVQERVDEPR